MRADVDRQSPGDSGRGGEGRWGRWGTGKVRKAKGNVWGGLYISKALRTKEVAHD